MLSRMIFAFSLMLLPAWSAVAAGAGASVHYLRCEYAVNPLGIDARQPRLSWLVDSDRRGEVQTAYQVLVASTPERLLANRADLWNSGKVASDQCAQVVYAGKPLASGRRCWWKVRVWDKAGQPSPYSEPAWWEMGLLRQEEWHGEWIGRTPDTAQHPAPLLRRAFALKGKVRRARVYVSGLGYYELRLNGAKVGDRVLDPGYTRYDRRALYSTYDVTGALREGENVLGAMLGNGWYNITYRSAWNFDQAPWRAAPKLLLELRVQYANGRTEVVKSDASWKTADGPILFNGIWAGETYDARLERPGWDAPGYDDSAWEPAQVVKAPGGTLAAEVLPIRVTETLRPVKLTQPKPDVYVFDMGQNFAGFARLTVSGPKGAQVVLKYGERLGRDGTVDQARIAQHVKPKAPGQQFQTDTYTLKGEGTERWHARFCYHGFQYVEVTGFPGVPTLDNLRGCVIHTDFPQVGDFECSNPLLNRIWKNTLWSYRSNFESIPTDCPHREKNGWTGDAHLAAELGLLAFDPAAAYSKWINDLDDEMRDSGELPGIVPTSGWGYQWGNGPAWDSAFLLIPWYVYQYCGDTRILETHYPKMRRYVDYLTGRVKEGIVDIGLGDWCPYKTQTPTGVTSTGYYYRDALIVAETAKLLGKEEDARKYTALAVGIRKAFNARFVDPKTGSVANGSQTALSCALYQGLADPERVPALLSNLVAAVEARGGHIDTGILGAKYLLNTLTDYGRTDVAYRIVSQKDLPGWGYWIEQGATTLWEDWGGGASLNHIMFGDVSAWMVKALAGIAPDPAAPGFRHFFIRPHVVGDLTSARASYFSTRGLIESAWKVENGTFTLEVSVPANATATVSVPAKDAASVTEGGQPAAQAEGVSFVKMEDACAVFTVGAGRYRFASR